MWRGLLAIAELLVVGLNGADTAYVCGCVSRVLDDDDDDDDDDAGHESSSELSLRRRQTLLLAGVVCATVSAQSSTMTSRIHGT